MIHLNGTFSSNVKQKQIITIQNPSFNTEMDAILFSQSINRSSKSFCKFQPIVMSWVSKQNFLSVLTIVYQNILSYSFR